LTGLEGGDGASGWLLLRFRFGLLAEVGGEGDLRLLFFSSISSPSVRKFYVTVCPAL
jgi:hypothetical protein